VDKTLIKEKKSG